MRYLIILLFFLGVLIACEKTEEEPHLDEVKIYLENKLSVDIDSFYYFLETNSGPDSILHIAIDPGENSSKSYFPEVHYYYFEPDDIFFINKAQVVIEDYKYFLSNCFCDQGLKEGTLEEGTYAISVEEVDKSRNTVNYTIKQVE